MGNDDNLDVKLDGSFSFPNPLYSGSVPLQGVSISGKDYTTITTSDLNSIYINSKPAIYSIGSSNSISYDIRLENELRERTQQLHAAHAEIGRLAKEIHTLKYGNEYE